MCEQEIIFMPYLQESDTLRQGVLNIRRGWIKGRSLEHERNNERPSKDGDKL